jgi:hypothetical protein
LEDLEFVSGDMIMVEQRLAPAKGEKVGRWPTDGAPQNQKKPFNHFERVPQHFLFPPLFVQFDESHLSSK